MGVKENFEELKSEIAKACHKARRNPKEINIMAVTKNQPIEKIKEAIGLGIEDIGENKIQELEEKYPSLKGKADIHFIGRLQSNKVKKAVEMADYIHSIDSLSLLRKVHYAALDIDKIQDIFLQVNTSGEKSKQGMAPKDVEDLLTTMKNLPYSNVNFVGLMTMAPLTEDEEILRKSFGTLFELKEHLNLHHLSMGMSNDYKIAIEEGATVIRVGRKLFG